MEAAVTARDAGSLGALVRELLRGDGAAAAALLRAAAWAAVGAQGSGGAALSQVSELGRELLALPGLSLASPRGRFDVALGTAGLALRSKGTGAKATYGPVSWGDITHFVKLAKPDPYSKKGMEAKAWSLVLPLRSPLEVGKQSLRCIVLNASSASQPSARSNTDSSLECRKEEADTEVGHRVARLASALAAVAPGEPEHCHLTRMLAAATGLSVQESEADLCPVESVRAYRGVDEGQLFPLRAGLFFLTRPARMLFLAAQEIASIECSSRAASTADLVISCNGANETFSNIANDDLLVLCGFMKVLAEARGHAGSAGGTLASGNKDDEEADEDYEPDDSEGDDFEPEADVCAGASGASSSARPATKHPAGSACAPPAKRTRRTTRAAGGAAAAQLELELPAEPDEEEFHLEEDSGDEDAVEHEQGVEIDLED